MVSNESLENIFASDKGILMAVVCGRFLLAENASIDIEREYDYSGTIGKKSGQTVTIEFDTRRRPYITQKRSLVRQGELRLYNEGYELHLKRCIVSNSIEECYVDTFVSHVKVESAGELTISER
jgi:hypothetical protein